MNWPSRRTALEWLDRWRFWISAILFTGMYLVGIDRMSTWLLFSPFLIVLLWMPAAIRGHRIVKRSGNEFKAGLRGDS